MKLRVYVNDRADFNKGIELSVSIEPDDGGQYRNVRRIPKETADLDAVAGQLEELAKWLRDVARLDPEVLAKIRR
jgi:hypothetical protein